VLAECIHEEFSNGNAASMRGLKQAEFAVLRPLDIPSALVELGFISNSKECKRMVGSSFQREAARSMSRGIIRFLEQNPPSPN
jgi:N-acetylmuramoyl-L-alanine amidase